MLLSALIPFVQIVFALIAFWLVFALLRIAREAGAARSAFTAHRAGRKAHNLTHRTDP